MNMKTASAFSGTLFLVILLSGCTALPKHELEISEIMRSQPVHQVYVMPPFFAPIIKRADPGDYRQMLPENQAITSQALRNRIVNALSASMNVDSSWIPGTVEMEWARKIGEDLAIGRVALGVPSVTCPVESILITGVMAYGTEKDQIVIHPLPFLPNTKPRVFGKVRWDHVTDIEAMLIRPSDGKVLFTLRHDERFNTGYEDSTLLEETAIRTSAAVSNVFRKAVENIAGR